MKGNSVSLSQLHKNLHGKKPNVKKMAAASTGKACK